MLKPLNDEDFKYLDNRYGKLILKAANSINGDKTQSIEDYAQEIWFTILDYMPKYLKLHSKTLQEFCEDPKFHGYVKQWIWTARNNIGGKITARKDRMGVVISLSKTDKDGENDNLDEASIEKAVWNEEFIPSVLAEMREGTTVYDRTLSSIAFDADSIKDNGAFNVAAIARRLNLPVNLINSEIRKIRNEFKYAIKH